MHEAVSKDALERIYEYGFSGYQHMDMDLHNNAIGRNVVHIGETVAYPAYHRSIVSDDALIGRINLKMTNTSSGIIWLHP